MDENRSLQPIKFNFKVGDYVNTMVNGYAHVVDILRSETSSTVAVCVKFTYNFPNKNGFDTLIVTPERPLGTDLWVATHSIRYIDELTVKMNSLKEKFNKEVGGIYGD